MQQPPSVPVPIPAAPEAARPTIGALVPEPSVRVGILADVARVSIGADSGVVVRAASRAVERGSLPRATFVPVATGVPAPLRYRVQAGSLADEAGAQNIASRVEETVRLKPTVQWNATTRTYQVRAGEFATRDEALGLANRLSRSGIPGAFVVEDRSAAVAGRVRLVETGDELTTATVLPAAPNERLAVDATAYRGVLEVRPARAAPSRWSTSSTSRTTCAASCRTSSRPQAFPELEALKAQAVAARTYALRNHGRVRRPGVRPLRDGHLPGLPRAQSTEHPLIDQAVDETRGRWRTWRGADQRLLHLDLRRSHRGRREHLRRRTLPTCGGWPVRPSVRPGPTVHTVVPPRALGDEPGLGARRRPPDGAGRSRSAALRAGAAPGIPADPEIRVWGVARAGGAPPQGVREHASTARSLGAARSPSYLVGSLCWEERGRRLLAPPGDRSYLLRRRGPRRASAGDDERQAAAAPHPGGGAFSPFPDNTLRPGAALTRAEAFVLLARAAREGRAAGPRRRRVRGASGGAGYAPARRDAESPHPLDPAVRLFRNLDGVHAAASEISLSARRPGRRSSFRGPRRVSSRSTQTRQGRGRRSRLALLPLGGPPDSGGRDAGDDSLRSVGTVRDIVPRRIGVSGRVVELAVRGSEGELVLQGPAQVRWGARPSREPVRDRPRDATPRARSSAS